MLKNFNTAVIQRCRRSILLTNSGEKLKVVEIPSKCWSPPVKSYGVVTRETRTFIFTSQTKLKSQLFTWFCRSTWLLLCISCSWRPQIPGLIFKPTLSKCIPFEGADRDGIQAVKTNTGTEVFHCFLE